ncbi:hypothetical protein [Cellulosimicrobium cellulans]|uniref:hypothetical protein n=1 Tax=Cellulosimicrobium cellulans TaxID=1710 RepID=UPI001BA71556|nr:hypothetical protein [Cellulosimicrobium cellulans]QUC01091.1 hypothetical protein J5A69_07955 [Cellulosimicrobium cellulans]
MLLLAAETATETTTVDWSTPTVVVAILAPIVALVGVLISNWWNGRNAIKAEDKRHENALAAEAVRHQNTIEAENLRAQKAIEAENLRHEHAVEQQKHARYFDSIRDLYVSYEGPRNSLQTASYFIDAGHGRYTLDSWYALRSANRAEFTRAFSAYRDASEGLRLFASERVVDLEYKISSSAFKVAQAMRSLEHIAQGKEGSGIDQGMTLEEYDGLVETLQYACEEMLHALQQELHPKRSTTDPSS